MGDSTTKKEKIWWSVGSRGMADQDKTQSGEREPTERAKMIEFEMGCTTGGVGGQAFGEVQKGNGRVGGLEKTLDRDAALGGIHATVEGIGLAGKGKKPEEMDIGDSKMENLEGVEKRWEWSLQMGRRTDGSKDKVEVDGTHERAEGTTKEVSSQKMAEETRTNARRQLLDSTKGGSSSSMLVSVFGG